MKTIIIAALAAGLTAWGGGSGPALYMASGLISSRWCSGSSRTRPVTWDRHRRPGDRRHAGPGASVHLALDHLGPGADALGAAVVVREGERRGGRLDVQVEAAGEGVQVGKAGGAGGGDPLLEEAGVVRVRGQQGCEGADEAGQAGHLGAGSGEAGEQGGLAGGEGGGPGEQEPGHAAG
jgi:hypothetical protein